MKKCESGLTLVEMLTAVSIIVIMAGSTYAVFNTAVKSYRTSQSKLTQTKSCRVALNHISTDLSQLQADLSDEMFTLFSEDVPTSLGNRDIISFVTLVRTDPDPFILQQSATENAAILPPVTDVRRVAYYIGPKIPLEERENENIVPSPDTGSQIGQNQTGTLENLALYRVVSTALNPELVINAFMDTGTKPTVDENGMPIQFDVSKIADGVVNFDLKYLDEEAPYDSWTQTDAIPIAVQILITVIDENRQESTSMQTFSNNNLVQPPGALTQSTMVYLPASATANAQ